MRRETQNLLLLLIGGAVLKIGLNGTYLRYVKPSLGPWLVASGAAAVLLAAVLIVRGFQEKSDEHRKPEAGGHDHQHAAGIAWLLLIPALVLLFAPPPVLSVDDHAVDSPSAAISVGAADNLAPLPPDGQPSLKLMDFVTRALSAPQTIDHREVTLTGFVLDRPEGLYLARVFIWCCVADARSVVVKLDVDRARYPPGTFANKQWAQLVGQYVPGSASKSSDYVPVVHVTGIEAAPEPEDVYEH